MSLKQNTLAEATTENGFPTEVGFPLQREVTLEDGTKVIVEGITPDKMKTLLNQYVDGNENAATFKTPGEIYKNNEVELDGVVQIYNDSKVEPDLVSIAVTTAPTKTTYYEGDNFDATGMVVTGTYSNETTKPITEYTVSPSENLATTDTSVTISYGGKTTTQAITVNAVELVSIAITTPPTKTAYTAGETFDPTGLVLTGTYNNGNTEVLEPTAYNPNTETALTTENTTVTVSYYELTAEQTITVTE